MLYVDAFGNCITNIAQREVQRHLPKAANVRIWAGRRLIGPPRQTYGAVPPGEPLAIFNSLGMLEVSVHDGRACDVLALSFGVDVVAAYADWKP